MNALRLLPLAALALAAAGCASAPRLFQATQPQDAFMARLGALCGRAFEGRVVTTDPADAAFASERLVMHVRGCAEGEVRIPFHVGDDRSRTWVITRTAEGLRLKHDHRHADGSPDALTMYGGDTAEPGTAGRQAFPVDEESRRMFSAQGREVSNTNTWGMEVEPGRVFVYELKRPPVADGQPGRHFRVEFDLTRPVAPPPPPWGAEAPSGAALPDRHE